MWASRSWWIRARPTAAPLSASRAPSPSAAASRSRTITAAPGCKYVTDVRNLYGLEKAPFFDPPRSGRGGDRSGSTDLDRIVRAFHDSPQCEQANRSLVGRRGALENAWDAFIRSNGRLGSSTDLARAKHLDYVMRTALYEGHIGARLQCLRRLRAQHHRPVHPQPRRRPVPKPPGVPLPGGLPGGRVFRQPVQHLGRVPDPDLRSHLLLPALGPGRERLLPEDPGDVRAERGGRGAHPLRQRVGSAGDLLQAHPSGI